MAIADQLTALVAQRDKLGVKVDALVGGGGGGGNESIGQLTDRIPDDMVPQVKIVSKEELAIPYDVANFCDLQDGTFAFVVSAERDKWLRRFSTDGVVTNVSPLPALNGVDRSYMYVLTDYHGRIFAFGTEPLSHLYVVDLNGVVVHDDVSSYEHAHYVDDQSGSFYFKANSERVREFTASNIIVDHSYSDSGFTSQDIVAITNTGLYISHERYTMTYLRYLSHLTGAKSADVSPSDNSGIEELMKDLAGKFNYDGATYLVTKNWRVYKLTGSVADREIIDIPPNVDSLTSISQPSRQHDLPGFVFIDINNRMFRAKMPGICVVNHPRIDSGEYQGIPRAKVVVGTNGTVKAYRLARGGNPTTLAVTTLK